MMICKLIGHTPRILNDTACRRCGEIADRSNPAYFMAWYSWPYRLYWWLRFLPDRFYLSLDDDELYK